MAVVLKLVTIVVEEAIAQRLFAEIRNLGASGYTASEARGEGSRGKRAGRIGEVNLRIETVVSEAVANRILDLLAERYFPHHACIAWVGDVTVVRGEKYA
jgi:nitrogen regulatory protein P-II 2